MAKTEWFELGSGFLVCDVIRWRDPVWATREPGDRKKGYRGSWLRGQELGRVGVRIISAEVIDGPDEDGWVYLVVRGYGNVAGESEETVSRRPPVGKEIRRKYKTLMNGEPERLLWDDETARARLVREVWGNKQHAHFMSMDEGDED